MLSVKEAAARLGVHPGTVYRWIWSGEMQHARLGKMPKPGDKGRGGTILVPEHEVTERLKRIAELSGEAVECAAEVAA